MSGGKRRTSVRAGFLGWKRVALASITVNVALVAAMLWSRTASGQEREIISEFIDTYFRTWSNRDMEGYKGCFHSRAVIHFVDGNGLPEATPLEPFIAGQSRAHAASSVPMREIPLAKEIAVDEGVARALVRWKLFNERGEDTGTDYFTLVKTKTGWKIISLVFRKDE